MLFTIQAIRFLRDTRRNKRNVATGADPCSRFLYFFSLSAAERGDLLGRQRNLDQIPIRVRPSELFEISPHRLRIAG
jgi:hypothetical protein